MGFIAGGKASERLHDAEKSAAHLSLVSRCAQAKSPCTYRHCERSEAISGYVGDLLDGLNRYQPSALLARVLVVLPMQDQTRHALRVDEYREAAVDFADQGNGRGALAAVERNAHFQVSVGEALKFFDQTSDGFTLIGPFGLVHF
jgi:hypothetical protein